MSFRNCFQCQRVFLSNLSTDLCRVCHPLKIPINPYLFTEKLFYRLLQFDSLTLKFRHSILECFHLLCILSNYLPILRAKGYLRRIRKIIYHCAFITHHIFKIDIEFVPLWDWLYSQYGDIDKVWFIEEEHKFFEWVKIYDIKEWNIEHLCAVSWNPSLVSYVLSKSPKWISEPHYLLTTECSMNDERTGYYLLHEWLYFFYEERRINDWEYFIQLLRFNLIYIDMIDRNPLLVSNSKIPTILPSSIEDYNYTLFYFLLYFRPQSFLWTRVDSLKSLCLYLLKGHMEPFVPHWKDQYAYLKSCPINSETYSFSLEPYLEWNPPEWIMTPETQQSFLSYIIHRLNDCSLHFEMASYLISRNQISLSFFHLLRCHDYSLICRLYHFPPTSMIWRQNKGPSSTEEFLYRVLQCYALETHQ